MNRYAGNLSYSYLLQLGFFSGREKTPFLATLGCTGLLTQLEGIAASQHCWQVV